MDHTGEEQLTSSSAGVTELLKHQFLQRIVHVEVSFNLKDEDKKHEVHVDTADC